MGDEATTDFTPSRRSVVTAIGLLPLASLAPALINQSQAQAAAGSGFEFFTAHQAAVIAAAAARLIPGPNDDPTEQSLNSPGATEAGVIHYIDAMLSMFDHHPPKIFAGGPWSDRNGGGTNHMKNFVTPAPRQLAAWKKRIKELRQQYVEAVKTLDAAVTGGDYTLATAKAQDKALVKHGKVQALIFGHAIEGMYCVPEYGGNKDLVGWQSVSWPGDSQPRGYTKHEVETSDGPDSVEDTGIVQQLLGILPGQSTNIIRRRKFHG